MKAEYDVIVIGSGIHGLFAAYHLVKSGVKTLLLDQFSIPNCKNSSCGHTRIFRGSYFGKKNLYPIILDSIKQWKRLPTKGEPIIRPWKTIFIGKPETLNDMANSIKDKKYAPKYLPTEYVKTKYGFSFSDEFQTFYDPISGVLMAKQAIQLLVDEFKRLGGVVKEMFSVSSVVAVSDKLVVVKSPSETLRAPKVVICAGPWAGTLLKTMGLDVPLRPIKIPVLYWKLKDPKQETVNFVDITDTCRNYYGTPSIEHPGYIKVNYHGGPDCNPSDIDATDVEDLIKEITEYAKKHVPFVYPKPTHPETCMYTMTPDGDFILDHHPAHPNVIFACGFSGTGFKIAPTIGNIISNLVQEKDPGFDISDFKLARFKQISKL